MFQHVDVDWTRAIEINQAALARIIAALVAVIEGQGGSGWISLAMHRAVSRILNPAESAVRRLIVIAARKLVVPPVTDAVKPSRPWPEGLVIVPSPARTRRRAFPLFEPVRYAAPPDAKPADATTRWPAIHVIEDDPRIPLFRAAMQGSQPAIRSPGELISIRNISDRLAAASFAIAHIPREAKRLLRALARDTHEFRRLVLRPGPPPSGRKKPIEEVDYVLKECHGLARDALMDSS